VPRRATGPAGKLLAMWLVCTRRCGSTLFRAIFAEVVVDANGGYQDHQIVQPGYLCASCGAPAVDLGAVPESMAEDAAGERATVAVDVLCPRCETMVRIIPGEECPNCGSELEVA
jgi:DNA-directed RNA polymerase subunit RPC12/RpoP